MQNLPFKKRVGNFWCCNCESLGCNTKTFEYQGSTYQGIALSKRAFDKHYEKAQQNAKKQVCSQRIFNSVNCGLVQYLHIHPKPNITLNIPLTLNQHLATQRQQNINPARVHQSNLVRFKNYIVFLTMKKRLIFPKIPFFYLKIDCRSCPRKFTPTCLSVVAGYSSPKGGFCFQ